jgi:dolichol-phosphate mannosyltransferase
MRTLVVLPTYQEAENISTVLEAVRSTLPDATILVVDDDSPDGTAEQAEKMGEKLGQIEVLRRPGKSGLGNAYRDGFRRGLAEGFDVLVEMDADLSHDPAELPVLLGAVRDGADLAIGSRYVPGGSTPDWSWWRSLISKGGNWYAAKMLDAGVRDSTAGFRAYRADMLRQIDLDAVRTEGYGFQVEMTYVVSRLGGRIVECPITFRDRVLGRSKMSRNIVIEAFLRVSVLGTRLRLARWLGPVPLPVPHSPGD